MTGWRHLPGALCTVAPRAADVVPGLFARNERFCTLLRSGGADIALVMVGAAGVGRISASFCDVRTNTGRDFGAGTFAPPLSCRKGDELGVFHLGSTVILVLGPGPWTGDAPSGGSPIRMGQAMFRAA